VSRATVYYQFKSKHGLLYAAIEDAQQRGGLKDVLLISRSRRPPLLLCGPCGSSSPPGAVFGTRTGISIAALWGWLVSILNLESSSKS
jgi:AcrR family transcriptional regulator